MTSAIDPLWELDLSEDGIEFDNNTRTVHDRRTGESIGPPRWMVLTSTSATTQTVERVWVRAAEPPALGTWHRSDAEE